MLVLQAVMCPLEDKELAMQGQEGIALLEVGGALGGLSPPRWPLDQLGLASSLLRPREGLGGGGPEEPPLKCG